MAVFGLPALVVWCLLVIDLLPLSLFGKFALWGLFVLLLWVCGYSLNVALRVGLDNCLCTCMCMSSCCF